jgi:hypothetical protein
MADASHAHNRVKVNAENNPGGARVCPEHGDRLECTKRRSVRQGGGQCHASAVRGTDSCKTHGGARLDVMRAKGEARITAWTAIGRPADGGRLEPGMAVLGMLQMTWLRAAAYGELLRQQVVTEAPPEPDREGFDPEAEPQSSGLIGYRYGAAGKDGTIYAVSEEIRALVALEAAERDRVVKYAKTAHDMGISERLTSLAERWGDIVAGRITLILAGLELTPAQEAKVPALIQAHLGAIDMDAMTGGNSSS